MIGTEILDKLIEYNNISIKNPGIMKFIPENNKDIILEFLNDLICSEYGNTFIIIYETRDVFNYTLPHYNQTDIYHEDTLDIESDIFSEKSRNSYYFK